MALVKFKKDAIKTKKFQMDSIDVNVEDNSTGTLEKLSEKLNEAADVINKLDSEVETVKKSSEAMKGELDQTKAELQKKNDELKGFADPNSDKIKKLVAEKTRMDSIAKALGIKDADKLDSKALKIEVIKAKNEKFDATGKSDEYLDASYNFVADIVDKEIANNVEIVNFNKKADDLEEEGSKADSTPRKDARSEFMKQSRNMWKDGDAKKDPDDDEEEGEEEEKERLKKKTGK